MREPGGEDAPGAAGGPLAEDGCGERGREQHGGTSRGVRRRGGRAPSPRVPAGWGELRAVGARGAGGELCTAKADGTLLPPPSLSVFSPRALGAGSGACGSSVSPRGPPSLPRSLRGGPCAPLPAGALTHGRGRPGSPAPGLGACSTGPARASPSAPCLPREGITCGRAGRFVPARCLVTVTESFPSRGSPAVSARRRGQEGRGLPSPRPAPSRRRAAPPAAAAPRPDGTRSRPQFRKRLGNLAAVIRRCSFVLGGVGGEHR